MRVAVSSFTVEAPAAIVHLEQDAFAARACSVCGSAEESELITDVRCGDRTSVELAFCRPCEHWYLRKLPSSEWYQWYYEHAFDSGAAAPRPSRRAQARYVAGTLRRRARSVGRERSRSAFASDVAGNAQAMQLFAMLLGVVEESSAYHAAPGLRKVLEIGCGYGGVLAAFALRGFDAMGTEASAHRAAACRASGLNVVDSPIDTMADVEREGPFDLVYSLHVLEHVLDPASHLEAVAGLVRPDGYLYVQVPYVLHEANVLHRAHSAAHSDSYSPRSLSLLVRRAGFVPLRLQIDNSLQILARRSEAGPAAFGPLPDYHETAAPSRLLQLLDVAAALGPGAVLAEWDHAYVELRRARTGEPLFRRPVHAHVDPLPMRSRLEFELDGGAVAAPVHFEHPGDVPPIATKQG